MKHHLANARSKLGAETTAQLVWILASRLPEPEGMAQRTKSGQLDNGSSAHERMGASVRAALARRPHRRQGRQVHNPRSPREAMAVMRALPLLIPMAGVQRAAGTCVATMLLAMSVAACGAVGAPFGGVRDRPENPKAIAPIVLVAQGSGPAGDYKVWAFRTSDGMTCLEVDSGNGSGAGCDPAGNRVGSGGGVGRNAHGVVVDASTAAASATTAVLHDASAADVSVALVDVGPILPGAKVAIFNLGPAANPVAVDFLDAGGSTVDSVRFP